MGSPRVITSLTGIIGKRLDYDEWGNVTLEKTYNASGTEVTDHTSFDLPFRFAGGMGDRDTGLVRFGARDYDPTVGMWTGKNPIRWAGRQGNLYMYVGEDPVNGLDPKGTDGVYTVEHGWDFGFIAGVDETWGQVTDLSTPSPVPQDYHSVNAAVGAHGGEGITCGGFGFYRGTLDDFKNSWGIRFQLALLDVTINFSSSGFSGLELQGGIGTGVGVAWLGGDTYVK